MSDPRDTVSRAAFERERASRKEAERLLEAKARELWERNEELRRLNSTLDELVNERTRELLAAKEDALAASRAKSDFLANVSHEIRTPLTAILGFVDLLATDPECDADPKLRLEHLATIRRNGRHLLSLINDILELARADNHTEKIRPEPASIQTAVRDIIELMSPQAAAKGIFLHAWFERVPELVNTDLGRVRQILTNLIGNAVKFTDHGHVNVRAAYNAEASRLRFDIIDTGIGMNAEQRLRVFNPFEQADTEIARKFGGTGLGLHISRKLARLLGGDITVSSTSGEGSTFTFELPVTIACATPNAVIAARTPCSSLNGIRILFADDAEDTRRLVKHHLVKAGATVTCVKGGLEALDALSDERSGAALLKCPSPFDVFITDVQMPEMDGYSCVRILRSRGCAIPIIALTACAFADEQPVALDAGCDAYLPKPIDFKALLTTIRWLCETDDQRGNVAA